MAIKVFVFVFVLFLAFISLAKPTIKIGSKAFTESYILAELLSQAIENSGKFRVERKFGLGGTGIVYEALYEREIDIYPEYTGTIKQVIIKQPNISDLTMHQKLLDQGIWSSKSFGFNNTYAIGVPQNIAEKLNIETISDLKEHPNLKSAFGYEYTKRSDGLKALEKAYGILFKNFKSMEHSLTYEALKNKEVDIISLYSTDAKIKTLNIKVLKDDKNFFSQYDALALINNKTLQNFPELEYIIESFYNQITEEKMIKMNSLVEKDKYSFAQSAATFFTKDTNYKPKKSNELLLLSIQHFNLVLISLLAAILFSIPLAILAYKLDLASQVILVSVGILQTIPSLALICFMIPLFGIGTKAALFALFIYALLPIVRSTYVGLNNIPKSLLESADTIGLNSIKKLLYIEIPLSSANILSGIKTSAIINVGTATLAAFIGAGGYGKPIVTGLALNDFNIILKGAIPAALMAILFHLLFEIIEKFILPKLKTLS